MHSHVGVILFKIEFAVRNGYTSAISFSQCIYMYNTCSWNQVLSSYPVWHSFCIVAWASQSHRHWNFTAKSWLCSFVYTRKPLRTSHRIYRRGSVHLGSTCESGGYIYLVYRPWVLIAGMCSLVMNQVWSSFFKTAECKAMLLLCFSNFPNVLSAPNERN